jgi:hypothetical protein
MRATTLSRSLSATHELHVSMKIMPLLLLHFQSMSKMMPPIPRLCDK